MTKEKNNIKQKRWNQHGASLSDQQSFTVKGPAGSGVATEGLGLTTAELVSV